MERIEQWPLTAAATRILLDLPESASAKGAAPPDVSSTFKLALKELILRGGYGIETNSRRFGKARLAIVPRDLPRLPLSLAQADALLRADTPGDVKSVIKNARKRHPALGSTLRDLFLEELVGHGLAEERQERGLLQRKTRWRRTAAGDAWAEDARRHLERFEALDPEGDPLDGARVAGEAGSVTLLSPDGLAGLGRLQARSRSRGWDPGAYWIYAPMTGVGFDPVAGSGELVDSSLGDGAGLDAGLTSVNSAIESMSTSIDSAVGSGVDSGGWSDPGGWGGGDFGGGGGGGDGGGGGSS